MEGLVWGGEGTLLRVRFFRVAGRIFPPQRRSLHFGRKFLDSRRLGTRRLGRGRLGRLSSEEGPTRAGRFLPEHRRTDRNGAGPTTRTRLTLGCRPQVHCGNSRSLRNVLARAPSPRGLSNRLPPCIVPMGGFVA